MKLKPGQVLEEFELGGHRVVFRLPGPGDMPGCLRHINRLVADRTLIGRQKRVTVKEERKWLRGTLQRIRKGDFVLVLVVLDGEVAGSASASPGGMSSNRHVGSVGIGLSRGRGLGIGTRLMRLIEKLARKHLKVKMLRLSVAARNRPAHGLYRKVGYREVGRIPRGFSHYGRLMDEVFMVKPLRR
ncbi:MAG: GNAT family N-acetyltransferase [Planctomycetota bacterium]|jgi:RimJ/RimL family protein N-acetyltransferase